MRTCQWLQILLLLIQSVKYEINEEFWMFWWALYCDTSAYIEFHFRIIWIIFLGTWMSSSSSSMLSLHILSLLYIHHKQTWYTHIHTRAYYSILLLLLYEVNINSFSMFSFLQRCKNKETNETFSETNIYIEEEADSIFYPSNSFSLPSFSSFFIFYHNIA